ncbi:MAG: hypothetical protein U0230_02500 [Polyangiales bacterium]
MAGGRGRGSTVAVFVAAATIAGLPDAASAESGLLNVHVEGGVAGVLSGSLSRYMTTGDRAIGGIGLVGIDYAFAPPFALEALVGFGGFAKGFSAPESGATYEGVAVGARLRFFDDTRGFLNDRTGHAHGNLWLSAHVGYVRFDGNQLELDAAFGYELSLFRPVSLGPFLRVMVAPGGSDPTVDTLILGGLSISIQAIGPARERDRDGDGLTDGEERDWGTEPTRRDTDRDGLPDGLEVDTGTDPAEGDSDGDGLPDGVEDANRDGLLDPGETDPRRRDTDGGGADDLLEQLELHTDPRNPEDDDRDGDGLGDAADLCPDTPPDTPVDEQGCPRALP